MEVLSTDGDSPTHPSQQLMELLTEFLNTTNNMPQSVPYCAKKFRTILTMLNPRLNEQEGSATVLLEFLSNHRDVFVTYPTEWGQNYCKLRNEEMDSFTTAVQNRGKRLHVEVTCSTQEEGFPVPAVKKRRVHYDAAAHVSPEQEQEHVTGHALQANMKGHAFRGNMPVHALHKNMTRHALQENMTRHALQENMIGHISQETTRNVFQENMSGHALQENMIGRALQENITRHVFQENTMSEHFQVQMTGHAQMTWHAFREQMTGHTFGENMPGHEFEENQFPRNRVTDDGLFQNATSTSDMNRDHGTKYDSTSTSDSSPETHLENVLLDVLRREKNKVQDISDMCSIPPVQETLQRLNPELLRLAGPRVVLSNFITARRNMFEMVFGAQGFGFRRIQSVNELAVTPEGAFTDRDIETVSSRDEVEVETEKSNKGVTEGVTPVLINMEEHLKHVICNYLQQCKSCGIGTLLENAEIQRAHQELQRIQSRGEQFSWTRFIRRCDELEFNNGVIKLRNPPKLEHAAERTCVRRTKDEEKLMTLICNYLNRCHGHRCLLKYLRLQSDITKLSCALSVLKPRGETLKWNAFLQRCDDVLTYNRKSKIVQLRTHAIRSPDFLDELEVTGLKAAEEAELKSKKIHASNHVMSTLCKPLKNIVLRFMYEVPGQHSVGQFLSRQPIADAVEQLKKDLKPYDREFSWELFLHRHRYLFKFDPCDSTDATHWLISLKGVPTTAKETPALRYDTAMADSYSTESANVSGPNSANPIPVNDDTAMADSYSTESAYGSGPNSANSAPVVDDKITTEDELLPLRTAKAASNNNGSTVTNSRTENTNVASQISEIPVTFGKGELHPLELALKAKVVQILAENKEPLLLSQLGNEPTVVSLKKQLKKKENQSHGQAFKWKRFIHKCSDVFSVTRSKKIDKRNKVRKCEYVNLKGRRSNISVSSYSLTEQLHLLRNAAPIRHATTLADSCSSETANATRPNSEIPDQVIDDATTEESRLLRTATATPFPRATPMTDSCSTESAYVSGTNCEIPTPVGGNLVTPLSTGKPAPIHKTTTLADSCSTECADVYEQNSEIPAPVVDDNFTTDELHSIKTNNAVPIHHDTRNTYCCSTETAHVSGSNSDNLSPVDDKITARVTARNPLERTLIAEVVRILENSEEPLQIAQVANMPTVFEIIKQLKEQQPHGEAFKWRKFLKKCDDVFSVTQCTQIGKNNWAITREYVSLGGRRYRIPVSQSPVHPPDAIKLPVTRSVFHKVHADLKEAITLFLQREPGEHSMRDIQKDEEIINARKQAEKDMTPYDMTFSWKEFLWRNVGYFELQNFDEDQPVTRVSISLTSTNQDDGASFSSAHEQNTPRPLTDAEEGLANQYVRTASSSIKDQNTPRPLTDAEEGLANQDVKTASSSVKDQNTPRPLTDAEDGLANQDVRTASTSIKDQNAPRPLTVAEDGLANQDVSIASSSVKDQNTPRPLTDAEDGLVHEIIRFLNKGQNNHTVKNISNSRKITNAVAALEEDCTKYGREFDWVIFLYVVSSRKLLVVDGLESGDISKITLSVKKKKKKQPMWLR